jgi:4'-phosphopantetheinyl transferase
MTTANTPICEWRHPPAQITTGNAQLDIWWWNLDDAPCQPGCLDATETERLNNFKFDLGRQQYCRAHTSMRTILSHYLGCTAGNVPVRISPGGKPRIGDNSPPLYFNLSHAGNVALLAVHARHEVGIDVEMSRDMPNIDRLAKRTFRKNEIAQLEKSGWDKALFFELWTHMEARQKCLGRGVFGDAVSENEVESRSLNLEGKQFAAIAWPVGNTPTIINFYRG